MVIENDARRHWPSVLSGVLMLLSMAAGFGAARWQAGQTATAEAVAERRADEIRTLASSLVGDLDQDIAGLAGSDPVREDALRRALATLERLAAESEQNEEYLAPMALGHRKLAELAMLRDDGGTARAQAQRALEASRTLLDARPHSPEARLSAATSHLAMGDLLADPRWPAIQDPVDALRNYRIARTLLEDGATSDPRVRRALVHARGGIEADLTITRLAEGRFYIVTGSGFGVRDGNWIERHLPRDGSVDMRDVTSARAVINLSGPSARNVLEKVGDDDVSHSGFPFLAAREIRIGYAPVLAIRITYVGELGWELHVPAEYATHVYERLWQAGADFGIIDAGYRAIETCRIEKRYLYWGADITPDYNPYEAGLGFCVALDKGEFIGGEALARAKAEGPRRRLCIFLLDEPAAVYGGEAIMRGGKVLGVTTSGGFGYTIGRSIVYGYVPAEEASHTDYEIEAFCRSVPATRIAKPPYDPERKRILC